MNSIFVSKTVHAKSTVKNNNIVNGNLAYPPLVALFIDPLPLTKCLRRILIAESAKGMVALLRVSNSFESRAFSPTRK